MRLQVTALVSPLWEAPAASRLGDPVNLAMQTQSEDRGHFEVSTLASWGSEW